METGARRELKVKVQTLGNVLSVDKQLVVCEVVGSMLSSLRELNALCHIRDKALIRTLLTPDTHFSHFLPASNQLDTKVRRHPMQSRSISPCTYVCTKSCTYIYTAVCFLVFVVWGGKYRPSKGDRLWHFYGDEWAANPQNMYDPWPPWNWQERHHCETALSAVTGERAPLYTDQYVWGFFLVLFCLFVFPSVCNHGLMAVCVMLCSQRGANDPSGQKHLHALVCAPSNAAVDNLMKKIIVFFKGKTIEGKIKGINWSAQKCFYLGYLHECTFDEHWTLVCLGNCGDINLVRLGSEKTICKDVVQFSLDRQTRSRTGEVFLFWSN